MSKYVFASHYGNAKVVTTLYGDVTPARIFAEKKVGAHRARQLDTTEKVAQIERIPEEEEELDEA